MYTPVHVHPRGCTWGGCGEVVGRMGRIGRRKKEGCFLEDYVKIKAEERS